MPKRPAAALLGAVLLTAALAVRLPTLWAGYPYLNYVDEGHVLHHVVHLLRTGGWDPRYYTYPSLPMYAVAAAAYAYSPVYAAVHGHSFRDGLAPEPQRVYGVLEPSELLLLGRLATLFASLGLITLTGLYAWRLAGSAAGWTAAVLAAFLPALVIRSAIVTVDPYAALFVLAALYFSDRALADGRPRRDFLLAGAMCGLALASKYPSALVALPVAAAALTSPAPLLERLKRLLLAGAAGALAAAVAMPALVLRAGDVYRTLSGQSDTYATQGVGSYWDQAVHRAEWDQPLEHPEVGIVFLAATAGGLVVALSDRRLAPTARRWLLLAAAFGLLFAPYAFRAFRNFLPLVPLACILIGILHGWIRERLPQPRPHHRRADLAAAAVAVLLFAPGLLQYVRHQAALADTRAEAVRWLAGRAHPGERVLVLEELAFQPGHLASLDAETVVRPWPRARAAIGRRDARFVVLGRLQRPHGHPIGARARREVLAHYEVRTRLGEEPTPPNRGMFRPNRQALTILERREAAPVGRQAAQARRQE